jgi:hypothetical protein
VTNAILVAQFLRARAWWRLDSVGANPLPTARSVVSLLDAAAYLRDLPDDDPSLMALAAAGCFHNGAFDPGPEGWLIVKEWQLADEATAGPADLLAALARAAGRAAPGEITPRAATQATQATQPASITVPKQAQSPDTLSRNPA